MVLNQIVTGDILSINNLKIMKLRIEYGVSCGTPKNHRETSVQPLNGKQIMLSSDPLYSLSNATFSMEM